MGGKKWDHVEDSTLRVWCDQESCKQLAKRLGRTELGVKSRLQTLGVKKKNIYQNKTWTKEMETFLKSRAGKQKPKSIAKRLGVSREALNRKASRLGVSLRVEKNRLWTESEMNLLIRQVEKSQYLQDYVPPIPSWDRIAKTVGRSADSCRKKAGELGLNLELKKEWKTTELRFIHDSRLMGVSYKSIANKLNRTESSVRKRYARYKKECNLT